MQKEDYQSLEAAKKKWQSLIDDRKTIPDITFALLQRYPATAQEAQVAVELLKATVIPMIVGALRDPTNPQSDALVSLIKQIFQPGNPIFMKPFFMDPPPAGHHDSDGDDKRRPAAKKAKTSHGCNAGTTTERGQRIEAVRAHQQCANLEPAAEEEPSSDDSRVNDAFVSGLQVGVVRDAYNTKTKKWHQAILLDRKSAADVRVLMDEAGAGEGWPEEKEAEEKEQVLVSFVGLSKDHDVWLDPGGGQLAPLYRFSAPLRGQCGLRVEQRLVLMTHDEEYSTCALWPGAPKGVPSSFAVLHPLSESTQHEVALAEAWGCTGGFEALLWRLGQRPLPAFLVADMVIALAQMSRFMLKDFAQRYIAEAEQEITRVCLNLEDEEFIVGDRPTSKKTMVLQATIYVHLCKLLKRTQPKNEAGKSAEKLAKQMAKRSLKSAHIGRRLDGLQLITILAAAAAAAAAPDAPHGLKIKFDRRPNYQLIITRYLPEHMLADLEVEKWDIAPTQYLKRQMLADLVDCHRLIGDWGVQPWLAEGHMPPETELLLVQEKVLELLACENRLEEEHLALIWSMPRSRQCKVSLYLRLAKAALRYKRRVGAVPALLNDRSKGFLMGILERVQVSKMNEWQLPAASQNEWQLVHKISMRRSTNPQKNTIVLRKEVERVDVFGCMVREIAEIADKALTALRKTHREQLTALADLRKSAVQDMQNLKEEKKVADERVALLTGQRLEQMAYEEVEALEQEQNGYLAQTVRRKQLIVEAERDSYMCVICLERRRSVLLLPCRHLCLCHICSSENEEQLRTCPLCQKGIENKIQTFL